MKTLAKYHVCNHCVIGEKHFKIYLSGPVSYRVFRETGPRSVVVASVVGKQNGVIDVLNSDKLTSQLIRATNVWFYQELIR